MLVILALSGSVLVAVAQGEGKLDGLLEHRSGPDRSADDRPAESEREDVVTHV